MSPMGKEGICTEVVTQILTYIHAPILQVSYFSDRKDDKND